MFDVIPYDITYIIQKMLGDDWESALNFNLVLRPEERRARRVFTKYEVRAHEISAIGQSLKLSMDKIADTSISRKKRGFYLLNMLAAFRKYNRQHIIAMSNHGFKNALEHKCLHILVPDSDVIRRATHMQKKIARKIAVKLLEDMATIVVVPTNSHIISVNESLP